MVGGGPALSPGEVTRADRGVLFLDELAEFDRNVLEALREPLEAGRVAIARAGRTMTFPARFQLVAAMNPCPCGFAGSVPESRCRCSPEQVARYQRRVSGPLRDRIDLWVPMARVAPAALVGRAEPEDSAAVAARIERVKRRSAARRDGRPNGRLRGRALRAACRLGPDAERRVVELAELELASGRGTERLLRVARTIADLADAGPVEAQHLEEAAFYRASTARLADALAS
jgi:magnesium chelatase family protein